MGANQEIACNDVAEEFGNTRCSIAGDLGGIRLQSVQGKPVERDGRSGAREVAASKGLFAPVLWTWGAVAGAILLWR